jgi:hypothetical protein
MRLGKRKNLGVSMLGLLSGLTLATSAHAQWRDERHGPVWRDDHARFEHRRSSVTRTGISTGAAAGDSRIDPASGPRTTSGGGRAVAW